MAVRIAHCGKSTGNYNLCQAEKVLGFTRRGPQTGDLVYLAVRQGKSTLCGMRARLADPTDYRPWPDADRYVVSYTLEDVEYCEPFDVQFLAEVGGEFWILKFLQGAKAIQDAAATTLLDEHFAKRRTTSPTLLVAAQNHDADATTEADGEEAVDFGAVHEIPEDRVTVMGTFQTIRFRSETDENQGLEPLVNRHFYSLFPDYRESHTLLIGENRLFQSAGVEARGDRSIRGIRSIPDALLIVYNKQQAPPIQVGLIEYECFGESKVASQEKSNYLNSHVIPQLMRFASSFSIVTDKRIRDQTIREWVDKCVQFVFADPDRVEKFSTWVKELFPRMQDQLIGRQIDRLLTEAFQNALRVILIIDELSTDQKDTIGNVISAFKLENGESIQFVAYVVRLQQRIAITDERAEYALSVQ